MTGGPGVFLDRDGVINRRKLTLVRHPGKFELLPGVPEAIARLDEAGYTVIVVTNQAPVGYGIIDPDDLEAVHQVLREQVEAAGAELAAIYHCPHRKGKGCRCAKPHPGMLERGAEAFGLDPAACWMVGDKGSDIQAGGRFGARTIWVTGSRFPWDHLRKKPEADFQAHDLPEAVDVILEENGYARA